MKTIVLASGGLDSATLIKHALHRGGEVHPLFVNYNQRHYKQEYNSLVNFLSNIVDENLKPLTVIKLSNLSDLISNSSIVNPDVDVVKTKDILGDPQPLNYVPYRNMLFLTYACILAEKLEASNIMYGAAKIDTHAGYWDGTVGFLNLMQNITSLNRKRSICIEAPLIKLSKKDILLMGIELGVDYSNTWTCYEGGEIQCGFCPACSSRIKGFMDAGFADPVQYSREIHWNIE
jgi:7-cyano-7-deazaguanine synthase